MPKISSKKTAAVMKKKLFVLDTNVLLHDPASALKFKEHDVYIPFVTIEELDNKKVGTQDINRNARAAIRLLDEISSSEHGTTSTGFPLIHHNGGHATGRLHFQDISLPFLPNEHIHKNDNLYLSVLKFLQDKYPDTYQVVMVTKDLNLRIKAKAMGFFAEDYKHDHAIDDADLLTGSIIELDEEPYANVENVQSWKSGASVYYKVPNLGWTCNQFLRVPSGKLYQVIEVDEDDCATLEPVVDYTNPKKAVFGVVARNEEQQAALALLLDPEVDFITLLGPAGTGKTLLTLAAGLAQIEEKHFDEIIFTRATIPLGEEIGFLPGTEEEKMTPWAGALYDNLEVLTDSESTQGVPQDKIRQLEIIKEKVKVKAMTFMRGRTLQRKYMIIDEAQNLTPKQMKALITRAGDGTKIICMGNLAQIDSPYLSETSSGLTYVAEKFKGWQHFGSLILSKGERSRLANEANNRL